MKNEELERIIMELQQTVHQRTKRALLNRLKAADWDEYPVALINYCFDRAGLFQEQTSVKVQCIKLLVYICRREPAFVSELRALLLQPSLADTAGMLAVKRNALKELEKIERKNYRTPLKD